MKVNEQFQLFIAAGVEAADMPKHGVVPMGADATWSIDSKNFQTMSVTPSIDANASGHWHGFITNGEVT